MAFQFNIDGYGYWDDDIEIEEYEIEYTRRYGPCPDGFCGANDCPRCRPLDFDKDEENEL